MTQIVQEPLFYCGDGVHRAKMRKVQDALRRRGLDALLLLKHDAVRYVTEFYAKGYRPFLDIEYAALVPLGRDPVLGFTVAGEERRVAMRSRVTDARRLPGLHEWPPALAAILTDYGLTAGRVGFDLMPQFMYQDLRERLPRLELVDAAGVWVDLSAVKHPLEVELIEQALKIAQEGTAAAAAVVAPGKTEIEVSAAGEYRMRMLGSEMNPFIPVVASGANAAIWERVATTRRIASGEMVILDFGCVHRGYTGDFARTLIVGDPTPRQRQIYRAAHDALKQAIAAAKPGALCSDVDRVVRAVIRDAGLEKYGQRWASGHQLGFGLHGEPLVGPGVDVPLEPGMVINLEPSLYTYDDLSVGGVELEDTVVITDTGCRLLTNLPFDEKLLR
ncbi:MAG TPA: Xaa-Pro peptidase family protein [bacterium]|nr:Xaa-Pro peptidase family protein [bacterium]